MWAVVVSQKGQRAKYVKRFRSKEKAQSYAKVLRGFRSVLKIPASERPIKVIDLSKKRKK